MDIEYLRGDGREQRKISKVRSFLEAAELELDDDIDTIVCIWDEGRLLATGSRAGYMIKCIAVCESSRDNGLMSTLMSALWQDAFQNGIEDLLVYTKPENTALFESLFFYKLAGTKDVVLLERERGAAKRFVLKQIENAYSNKNRSFNKAVKGETRGAAVMNCNPFTLGHRYLIEEASKQCDSLYVFVVSEEASEFSVEERFELVKKGCADLDNVYVAKTGPYLISKASFPQYFIRDKTRVSRIKCELDLEIFSRIFAKELSISRRFFGSEPTSETTRQYNEAMKEYLPNKGIETIEIERMKAMGEPISASRVRELFNVISGHGQSENAGKNRLRAIEDLKDLLPETSFDFLLSKCEK